MSLVEFPYTLWIKQKVAPGRTNIPTFHGGDTKSINIKKFIISIDWRNSDYRCRYKAECLKDFSLAIGFLSFIPVLFTQLNSLKKTAQLI